MHIIKYLLIILVIAALAWAGFSVIHKDVGGISEEAKNSGIETALLWSGIDALPTWAQDIAIETNGSSFTREIVLTFTGEPQQVYTWFLDMSSLLHIPLTSNFDPDVWHTYTLDPQSGAQSASLSVHKSLGEVKISVSWS